MTRVGVLTMHRVCNYGSALQAWATQTILQHMGFEVRLIDYVYPNDYHRLFFPSISLKTKILRALMNCVYHHPMKKKEDAFRQFRKKHFLCTSQIDTKERLLSISQDFDVYLVGSDQVWNMDVLHEDYSFYLDFIPDDKLKVSYASSFSKSDLNNYDIKKIGLLLDRFKAISVREKNGQKIIKELINKDVPVCLDPSLLLERRDYLPLAEESTIKVEGDYILVYVLNYAFDPYPFATHFIEELSRKSGRKVVCIDFSHRQHLKVQKCIHFHDALGPAEFLWLFMHASVVVTTSFHGTAFALNFEVPFYSIVNNVETGDDRMLSLIRECGAESQVVYKDSIYRFNSSEMDWEIVRRKISDLRELSFNYLRKSLK